MSWQFPIQILPLFVAASLGVTGAALARSKRDSRESLPLAAFLGTAGWWSLAGGLALIRSDMLWEAILTKGMYVGIALTPPAWLLFILVFTGRDGRLTRRRRWLLFVVPMISIVAVWTNDPGGIHTLFWVDPGPAPETALESLSYGFGPLFWFHAVYSYACLALGSYWLLRLAVFSEHLYRSQSLWLFLAVLAPWGVNGLYLLGAIQTPYDPTILGIVLGGFIVIATIHRNRLLEVLPAARELARTELIETLDDPVVVIDDERRVIDVNPAAVRILGLERRAAIGEDLETMRPDLARLLDRTNPEQTTVTYEIDNGRRYYDVQVTSLSRGYGTITGQILSLRDVTAQRHHQQQLSVMNRLLRHNLRNAITTIRGNAEYVADDVDDEEIIERMDVIASNAEDVMAKRDDLERVLRALDSDERPVSDAETIVESVLETVRETHHDANVSVRLPDEDILIEGRERLEIALEELLTNAIVHHDGSTPSVRLSVSAHGETVEISVSDDGPGIPDHEIDPVRNGQETPLSHGDGVGLWLVSWILHSLDGTVEFDVENVGSVVTCTLPRSN